ncbi:MAG: hypothetical protein ACE5I2_10555 [Anaerolineae bacterium]
MSKLILEGDPTLLAQFDKELLEEFAAQGLAEQVTVETQTIQAKVAPGEMGFGEEIRQILVGVADVLQAGKEAISKLAEGMGKRLARNSLRMKMMPDGTIILEEEASGESNASELAKEIAEILRAKSGGKS